MATLLHINSSVFGETGISSQLARHFVETWTARKPDCRVIFRDVVANPIPHLDGERARAMRFGADSLTEAQKFMLEVSDQLLNEIRQAELIVLGVPMYNFSVPSQLKSYFDHVARVGIAFKYTENGPVGLLENKPVYVLAVRGGLYQTIGAGDSQTSFLAEMFELLGLTDIHFVYAEGVNISPDRRKAAVDQAKAEIDEIVRDWKQPKG